jgi:hypothetical protein
MVHENANPATGDGGARKGSSRSEVLGHSQAEVPVKPPRPTYTVRFWPQHDDGLRALRMLLKVARRRYGLVALDAHEDRGGRRP